MRPQEYDGNEDKEKKREKGDTLKFQIHPSHPIYLSISKNNPKTILPTPPLKFRAYGDTHPPTSPKEVKVKVKTKKKKDFLSFSSLLGCGHIPGHTTRVPRHSPPIHTLKTSFLLFSVLATIHSFNPPHFPTPFSLKEPLISISIVLLLASMLMLIAMVIAQKTDPKPFISPILHLSLP